MLFPHAARVFVGLTRVHTQCEVSYKHHHRDNMLPQRVCVCVCLCEAHTSTGTGRVCLCFHVLCGAERSGAEWRV